MGVPMAPQAIPHPHRHVLEDDIHVLYLTVTGLAGDPRVDVRPVVEIDVVGQRVNPPPVERTSRLVDRGQLLDRRALGLGDAVAVHAGIDGGDARVPRSQCASVAVLARDLQRPRVQPVRIRDRLLGSKEAHEAIRLGEPAHRRHREEDRPGSHR